MSLFFHKKFSDLDNLPETVEKNPSHIWIEPTDRCNTRCIHCRHYYSNFGRDMPDEVYQKIVDEVLDDVTSMDLIGYGEPLLAKNFEKMYDDCLKREILVYTTTNGILLKNEALLEKIIRGGMRLCLSVDGARAETFEFVRPYIKWSSMLEILERIKNCAERVLAQTGRRTFWMRFNFVLMKNNVNDLPDMVRLAAKYGASEIFVMPVAGEDYQETIAGQSLHDSPELVSPAYLEALALARNLGVDLKVPAAFQELILQGAERRRGVGGRLLYACRKIRLGLLYLQKNGFGRTLGKFLRGAGPHGGAGVSFCGMPWNDAYFAADGSIYPCCVLGSPMGNLANLSWREIWNGLPYRNLRRTIHGWNPTAVCRYCGFAPGINGGDERRYAKFFSKFKIEDIPLDAPDINFGEGFYQLEMKPDGSPSHRWMSKRGRLTLRRKRGARFLRLLINPRCFDDLNPGWCRINGGAPHYFDNTCGEINFPLEHVKGANIELELEMEKTYRAVNDPRDLALPIWGARYLVA